MVLVAHPALGKTHLGSPVRDIELAPTSFTSQTTAVYHKGDVVLRVLFPPADTVRLTDAVGATLSGFSLAVPAGTVLQEVSYSTSPTAKMFSKADGRAATFAGRVFCTLDDASFGPFLAPDAMGHFRAVICLIDADRDSRFEAISLVQPWTGREIGAVPIGNVIYSALTGKADGSEGFDLLLDSVTQDRLRFSTKHYIGGKKQGYGRLFVSSGNGPIRNVSAGCSFDVKKSPRFDTGLGVSLMVSNKDVANGSFEGQLVPNGDRVVGISDVYGEWVPSSFVRCGG